MSKRRVRLLSKYFSTISSAFCLASGYNSPEPARLEPRLSTAKPIEAAYVPHSCRLLGNQLVAPRVYIPKNLGEPPKKVRKSRSLRFVAREPHPCFSWCCFTPNTNFATKLSGN